MLLPAYTRYTGQLTTERNNDRDFNLSQGLLLCSEGLAAHRSVDGIEGAQAISALVNTGHVSRPGPFGSPDLAKLTQ